MLRGRLPKLLLSVHNRHSGRHGAPGVRWHWRSGQFDGNLEEVELNFLTDRRRVSVDIQCSQSALSSTTGRYIKQELEIFRFSAGSRYIWMFISIPTMFTCQAASPTFNGFIGGQVQYSRFLKSRPDYGDAVQFQFVAVQFQFDCFSGESIASQPVVGLDSAQLFGRRKRSESGGKRKKKLVQKMSSSKRKSSTGRKQSSQKTSRKQTRKKENKASRKQSREKEKVSERKSARKSSRKGQRSKKRKSAKSSKRKKQRKRKRKLSGEKKRSRKERRRRRRKQERAKLRRIEDSRLGKPVPEEKMEMFRENFRRGKEKVGGSKILKNVENPFEKRGRLRSDFRKLVREKVFLITHYF